MVLKLLLHTMELVLEIQNIKGFCQNYEEKIKNEFFVSCLILLKILDQASELIKPLSVAARCVKNSPIGAKIKEGNQIANQGSNVN